MPDTELKKGILKSIRSGLRWTAHVILIPVVAALKGLSAAFSHLHDEIAKV